jgi:hypothetical protein
VTRAARPHLLLLAALTAGCSTSKPANEPLSLAVLAQRCHPALDLDLGVARTHVSSGVRATLTWSQRRGCQRSLETSPVAVLDGVMLQPGRLWDWHGQLGDLPADASSHTLVVSDASGELRAEFDGPLEYNLAPVDGDRTHLALLDSVGPLSKVRAFLAPHAYGPGHMSRDPVPVTATDTTVDLSLPEFTTDKALFVRGDLAIAARSCSAAVCRIRAAARYKEVLDSP